MLKPSIYILSWRSNVKRSETVSAAILIIIIRIMNVILITAFINPRSRIADHNNLVLHPPPKMLSHGGASVSLSA